MLTSTVTVAALVPSILAIISEFILAQYSAVTSTILALDVVTAPTATEGVMVSTLIKLGVAIYLSPFLTKN